MKDFLDFIATAPTSWHAAQEIGKRLTKEGFLPLSEKATWKLEAGKSYFVEREGTLVCAFRIPKQLPTAVIILASHTDSPALKLKPQPDSVSRGIAQLSTELYGGPLLHSWFDRDLAIAGKIETDKGSSLVHLSDCPVIIPQLAIHLDRSLHEKGIMVHKQDHLKAILSLKEPETLETLLKKKFSFSTLYAFDLYLVPTEQASLSGAHQDLIAGYRIDNLSSAYACLEAILLAKPRTEQLQCSIFWDHEEIGSMSSTGAGSLFVDQVLERIGLGLGQNREDFHRLKSNALILSADVAHAWNPNFAEKYDPQNSPLMGQGVILKFNASRKYASDATSIASLCKIAEKQNIPLQRAANRSDIPSGSTVGPIMSANTGIPTIDLGVGCWAMHSTREIIATSDQQDLSRLLKAALDDWS
jgi:aspartyl aminopeptidase